MAVLLERDAELEVLCEATSAAASGSGAVVLVHGEPGIGKSTLVRTYLGRLDPGVRTFVGACDDLITPRALGPFRDAVRWRGGPLAAALEGGGDRDRIFDAIVEELSHPREVTVLVVEDVHWADDATLDLLQYVVRRIDTLRAVVLLTYRDDEVHQDHPLMPLLARAAGPALRRIRVPRLSSAAVAVLAADSALDPATVYAVTGGNAFFVTEMVASPTGDVPATVVDAVLARVRQLDDATQEALEQLSVVPSRVEHWLVDELVGGLGALAEAEQHGMLRIDRERVAFRHELARRAIAHSLPAARRLALNRALVATLVAAPTRDVARIVHHAVEASDVDTIVAYAPAAAREAARAGSHRQALQLFEEVLRHEDRVPAAELPRLLEEYAWELYNAHRFVAARDAAERACALWDGAGDPAGLGTAYVTLSRHRWMCGDHSGAWAALETAAEILDGTDDLAARAQAHTYRGAILALQEQVDEAIPVLERAQALAEAAGSETLAALCLNYRGICAMELRQEEQAIALQRESVRRAKAAHDRDTRSQIRAYAGEHIARAYANLAASLHIFEAYDELESLLAEAVPYVVDRDFTSHAYNLEVRRCAMLIHRGQWDAAEEALRALDDSVDDPGVLGRYMLPLYGRLLARRGRPEAEQVLERAIAYADRSGVPGSQVDATIAYLEWAWLNGKPQLAAGRYVAALSALRPDRQARQLGELRRYARRAGFPDAEPFDQCPPAWAAGLRGEWFTAAVEWQRVGNDYERALELIESGDIGVTTDALAILDRLGATAAASLVRRMLRELGARRVPRGPQPATQGNPGGLTGRQVDVLRLLARGLTNAEIADELVLSVRTVDHHVAAILEKLDVPSRRTAAQRAVELGVLG